MRYLLPLLLLTGCSDPYGHAKERVAAEMKDPGSAQFRGLERFDGLVCGEVNARNSYGGYVGFQPFYVRGEDVVVAADTGDELVDATVRAKITNECLGASTDRLNEEMRLAEP